ILAKAVGTGTLEEHSAMILRRACGWLAALCSLTILSKVLADDEPTAEHPKAAAVEAKHDAESPRPKLDKAEAAKQAAKDEEEFYDLYRSLADTVDQVDRNYVKKVDRRELMEAAIKGVMSKLDPYSNYIGRDEADRFKDTVENQFGGIGIQITIDEN